MSDRELQAKIIAVDKASPIFKQVADGAAKMGSAIDQSAKRAAQSLRDNKKAVDDLKIGVGALATAFTLAARQNVDQERTVAALQRRYGEATDELLKFADGLQKTTTFSNDAARSAEAIFGTLATNYGLTADQIQRLTTVTADLAAATGFSLEDAATRVQAAIRGEAEAAEALGLTMNQQAIDREGLTLTMSNQEAAQFRLNALYQQAAFAEGAAAERAATTAGRVKQLTNEVQDAAQGFISFTGPVGEVAASLSDNALQIALVGGGLVKLVSAARQASVGTAALNLALGPAGLVLAAGAAAAAIAYLWTQETELEKVHQAAAGATTSFANELAQLGATGNAAAADFAKVSEAFGKVLEDQNALAAAIAAQGGGTAGIMDALDSEQINKIRDAIIAIFNNPFVDSSKVTAELVKVFAQFQAGEIDSDDLTSAVSRMNTAWSQFAKEADSATKGADSLVDQTERLARAAERSAQRWREYDDAIHAARQADIDKAKANRELLASMSVSAVEERAQLDRNQQKWDEYDAAVRAANDSRVQSSQDAADYLAKLEAERAALAAEAQAAVDAANALGVLDTYAKQLRPIDIGVIGGDRVTGAAALAQTAGSAFDSVLGIFSTIEQMQRQTGQAASIAEGLIGKPGEWADIDRLLEQHRISRTRYNMTVEAGNNILRRQEGIERDLQVIQAKQLPVLDAADKAYAKEIDRISHLSAEQQTAALGFLDSAEAQKVNTAVALAAAAAQTEAGSAARQSAEETIKAAALADPVFKAMAESIGLITEDKEGHITVNFDNANSLQSTIDDLTTAIENLTAAITTLDGTDANPSVTVVGVEPAISNLATLQSYLTNLDGTVATTTVNTIQNTIQGGSPAVGLRHGGTVPFDAIVPHAYARHGYATDGWTAITVGEAGRETVLAPGGSYVRNAAATAAAGGRGVGPINVYVNEVHGFAGVQEFVTELSRAVTARWASLGM